MLAERAPRAARPCPQRQLVGPSGVDATEQRFDQPVGHLVTEPVAHQPADGEVVGQRRQGGRDGSARPRPGRPGWAPGLRGRRRGPTGRPASCASAAGTGPPARTRAGGERRDAVGAEPGLGQQRQTSGRAAEQEPRPRRPPRPRPPAAPAACRRRPGRPRAPSPSPAAARTRRPPSPEIPPPTTTRVIPARSPRSGRARRCG